MKIGILYIPLLLLAACANYTATENFASSASGRVGCESFRSDVFDSMYEILDKGETLPSTSDFQLALAEKLTDPRLLDEVSELYKLLNEGSKRLVPHSSPKDQLRFLIQLEFENSSTQALQQIGREIREHVTKIRELSHELQIDCVAPNPPRTPPVAQDPLGPTPTAILGGHLAFATAYQSCAVLDLPEMTSATPSVRGIGLGEKLQGNAGYPRFYDSISEIQKSHYYIKDISYAPGCVAVKDQPLVYDYGGEPSVTAKGLNFFVNAGTGGSALGMDCSAFISSAIAAAGLRYSPGLPNKPIYVRQSSENFINPQNSNWKCFDRVAVSPFQTIVSGDIMAVQGHVLMIDRVGADPFGITNAKTSQQCDQLKVENFDFSVLQSSPSKSSIGMNRYIASDYLPEEPKMTAAFSAYAKAECLRKITGKSISVDDTSFGLIRHKGTPECLAPKVRLENENCVSSCSQLTVSD